ncbi:asparagine synthase (glutamine-hydrolyzing) [Synechococcus sp. W4D4]|uniref:asparagine synthase (glutamine-hydrolyzing) n=1 Tax=Synechococcus sp. W4D4 TaxID=3392294 RepID=UPI0039EBD375
MCGLAGELTSGSAETMPRAQAARIAELLLHRGPDDSGIWQSRTCTLIHRRLSIQDLSPAGHQPMQSSCGRYRLVFNGEIYNYKELRNHLESLGERFVSTGDTEVLLRLLIREGAAALPQLRGMFAFCLFDQLSQSALLGRDPFGIKPLYLYRSRERRLLFSSEVRALLRSGAVPRELNGEALQHYLMFGCVPQLGTLVQGLNALPPGHLARWQNGELAIERYWHPRFGAEGGGSYDELVERTRSAVSESVKAHMVSDVPVGLFLSGGMDSSAILAASDQRLTTLSIGFEEEAFDESALAEQVARRFGSDHRRLLLRRDQAWSRLPAFFDALDQPSTDGFNTYCVSAEAADAGLKVVMSGLGGDELFGGYPLFQTVPKLLALRQRLGPAAWAASQLIRPIKRAKLQRFADYLASPAGVVAAHRCMRTIFSAREASRLIKLWNLTAPATPPLAELPEGMAEASVADQLAWLETSSYMGGMLLRDSDALSMASSLELRVPLVDVGLFEALSPVAASERLAPGKQLLRDAFPEVTALLKDAPKRGFVIPFDQWLRTSSEGADIGGLPQLDLRAASRAVDLRPWARQWGLFVLADWLERNMGIALQPG